jgi:hypothetical protein
MGNIQVIRTGEVQVMTAGTGIYHAEFNHSETEKVKLLQLWIFPREKGLKPRYDQMFFTEQNKKNELITLVTPDTNQEANALWIHQDAYISTYNLQKDSKFSYTIRKPGNGVFVFMIEGKSSVDGNVLEKRDAIACSDTESIQIIGFEDSKVLFIEVPMK